MKWTVSSSSPGMNTNYEMHAYPGDEFQTDVLNFPDSHHWFFLEIYRMLFKWIHISIRKKHVENRNYAINGYHKVKSRVLMLLKNFKNTRIITVNLCEYIGLMCPIILYLYGLPKVHKHVLTLQPILGMSKLPYHRTT